jgi:hypothetical protein
MRSILILFVLLFAANNLVAQTEKPISPISPEGTAEFTVSKGAQVAKLILTSKSFVPSAHRIVRTKDCVTIDGRKPIGTDCGIPRFEIASMRLFINGKEVVIPRSFYSDCYTPPFFKDYKERGWMQNYLALKFSDDLKGVFVFLAAGDGAGVYDAIWIFRKDGHHSRFTNSGGDCRLLNFDCRPNMN